MKYLFCVLTFWRHLYFWRLHKIRYSSYIENLPLATFLAYFGIKITEWFSFLKSSGYSIHTLLNISSSISIYYPAFSSCRIRIITFVISTSTNGSRERPKAIIHSKVVSVVRLKKRRRVGISIIKARITPDTSIVQYNALLCAFPLAKTESILERWFIAWINCEVARTIPLLWLSVVIPNW